MTYRDPLAGVRSQVAVKRAVLEERTRALTPVLRALLPEDTRAILTSLAAAAHAEADTLDTLAAADAALDGLLAAYDAVVEQSTRLRWCAEDPGTPPRPWIAPPWLIEEGVQLQVRRALDGRLSMIDAEPVERWGDRGYRSHIAIEGVRALFFFDWSSDSQQKSSASMLRVTVPESLQRITVMIEGLTSTIGKKLGFVREVELGDPDFDRRFLVVGAEASTAVLTPRVRHALLELPGKHLRLTVGPRFATLTWGFEWRDVGRDAVPPAALEVIAGIREAIAEG